MDKTLSYLTLTLVVLIREFQNKFLLCWFKRKFALDRLTDLIERGSNPYSEEGSGKCPISFPMFLFSSCNTFLPSWRDLQSTQVTLPVSRLPVRGDDLEGD